MWWFVRAGRLAGWGRAARAATALSDTWTRGYAYSGVPSVMGSLGVVRRMRWTLVALLGLVVLICVGGCENLNRRGVVARAGDWTLTEARLAELLVLAQPFPLDRAAADDLVRHWMVAAAIALVHQAGEPLSGVEATQAATWLNRREHLLALDREQRLGDRVRMDREQVRRVFEEGSLRMVAHVLRRTGPETSSSERILQQRTAERLLQTLVDGGAWDQIVAESEDVESKANGGLLGLFARGELPSTLDRAVFLLEPGQVSSVVQSRQGYHLLYRPRFDEIGSIFTSHLVRRRLAEEEERVSQTYRETRDLRVTATADVILAAILRSPVTWLESLHVLATWMPDTNGTRPADPGSRDISAATATPLARVPLTTATAARYVVFLPASTKDELLSGDPYDRMVMVRELATREMRLADADARGLALDSATEASMQRAYADELEFWTQALSLGAPDPPARTSLARHMERVVSRQEEARVVPRLLEAWLFGRVYATAYDDGVLAAIVRARRLIEEAGT